MIQSVERAADILELFISHKSLKAREIAEHLNLHINTTRNIVQTLEKRGFLCKTSGSAYSLGHICHLLGLHCTVWGDLKSIALPHMKELAQTLGNNIFLGGEKNAQIFCIAEYEGGGSILVAERQNWIDQLHCTACGKIFLAYGRLELWKLLQDRGELPRVTDATVTDLALLKNECESIAANGWVLCKNESYDNISSLAVGVFNKNHVLLASLCEYFPTYFLDSKEININEDVLVLKKAAREIAAQYNLRY
jgi:DNA-binding IclR family transcriptional regulator